MISGDILIRKLKQIFPTEQNHIFLIKSCVTYLHNIEPVTWSRTGFGNVSILEWRRGGGERELC